MPTITLPALVVVTPAQAWPFVQGTPEGTRLWPALLEWRRLYEAKQAETARLARLKPGGEAHKHAAVALNTAKRALIKAYGTCLLYLKRALREPANEEYREVLDAFCTELGASRASLLRAA